VGVVPVRDNTIPNASNTAVSVVVWLLSVIALVEPSISP
jgi:hypothetical protein